MKALTLTQPWAYLVAHGHKGIETRSWSTHYRGVIAIHAARALPPDALLFALAIFGHNRSEMERLCPRGVIVATATILNVLPTGSPAVVAALDSRPQEKIYGDFTPGRYAWFLELQTIMTPPRPARGALGLWDWVDEESPESPQQGELTMPGEPG